MSNVIKEFGLIPNADYTGCQVEVEHKDGSWYPLVKTANKILFYEDYDENIRRMNPGSLVNVNFINGKENTEPVVADSKNDQPTQVEIVEGVYSNTNYEGEGILVNHIDKGWFPLVRTSNKVIYYLEDNKVRRLTLKKFGGIKKEESENTLSPFPESPDTFFDNFDYDMVG